MNPTFVHLRVHSAYSLGMSSIKIPSLVSKLNDFNMPAVAVTDLNNLFGAKDFSGQAINSGIKPIIGLELQVKLLICKSSISTGEVNHELLCVAPESRDSSQNYIELKGALILLATNDIGYKNLLKLHKYLFFKENPEGTPYVDLWNISECSEGLIALTGGNSGLLAELYQLQQPQLIDSLLSILMQSFDNNRLYIELNRFSNQKGIYLEDAFLNLAQKYNLPIVATGDCYFRDEEDFTANDILTCIGGGTKVNNCERIILSSDQYLKSPKEMHQLFEDLPEALENSVRIAERCNFWLKSSDPCLPVYQQGIDEEQLLKSQAEEGLKERLQIYFSNSNLLNLTAEEKENIIEEYKKRLDFELNIISSMNFCGYFLIVSDFINWAYANDIPVGPGRGSGAGSLVAWSLKITDINPIEFGLIFERFLNPERISMPDFDIDFCQKRRGEIIKYVAEKYGNNCVAHIITFGTMQTRGVIRDVGRALDIPYSSIDKLCKRIPYGSPSSPSNLVAVLEAEKSLKEDIDTHYTLNELFTIGQKLEGLYKNASTHAAGVIISSIALEELVPLYKDSSESSTLPAVGFSMKHAEAVGLVKFDFLGLKTLTVIKNTLKDIQTNHKKTIDMHKIALRGDDRISDLLKSGKTLGIFQMESAGMREAITQIQPDKIEDIIALISLYRPGPMENIPNYVKRKHGIEAIPSLHPLVDYLLSETFGIMVYQEQVMQVAQILANYTLGEADILRRAMGKKQPQEMAEQKDKFVKGAIENQIDKKLAEKIFFDMEKFAGYGFNKSHAAAYAYISWQTAYLKAYYTADFIANSMTYDMQDIDKIIALIEDAKSFAITVLPPDINSSDQNFKATNHENKSAIIYSLLALKGSSQLLVNFLEKERIENGIFTSLADFLKRIPSKLLSRKQLEVLIKSGALDSIHNNRGQLLENLEDLLDFNQRHCSAKNSLQASLFDDSTDVVGQVLQLKPVPDLPMIQKLIYEADILGFFLSSHPLLEYEASFEKQDIISYQKLVEDKVNRANLAVVLLKVKVVKNRNSKYLLLTCSDIKSNFQVVVFGKNVEHYAEIAQPGSMYKIRVNARFDSTDPRVVLDKLSALKKTVARENKKNKINNILESNNQKANVVTHNLTNIESEINIKESMPDDYQISQIQAKKDSRDITITLSSNEQSINNLIQILTNAKSGNMKVHICVTFSSQDDFYTEFNKLIELSSEEIEKINRLPAKITFL